jgi:hypothetical protein
MCIKDYKTKIGGQDPVRAVELLMKEWMSSHKRNETALQ